jgi:hypothetical protein
MRLFFSSDSQLKSISGFEGCTSLCRIEIPSLVEIIGFDGFRRCTSLNEIIFSSDSQIKDIQGFGGCTSLCRIEIPSSVAIINGFSECTSLNEIVFSSDSQIKEISGFEGCTSLCRIEIPSSVEVINSCGFDRCTSLRVGIIHTGCRMKQNGGFRKLKPFLVHEDSDLKESRHFIHLGTFC